MSEQLFAVHCDRADVVLKRSGPARWRLIPITASGRFA